MNLLILGGTAWLGRTIAETAVGRGDDVTCLARGESGPVAAGATLVAADRTDAAAYSALPDREWDAVVEVSWQPGQVGSALAALGDRARHWTYVSSASVYAQHDEAGADESASLLPATELTLVDRDLYGEAKVTCENLARETVGDRLLVARAGLIGGPGDHTDRTGYWPARAARDPAAPMLVPENAELSTQVVDVRDLSTWLLDGIAAATTGTYNAVGPVVALGDWIAWSRQAAGHTGPTVPASDRWLLGHEVAEFMGPESLPLWLGDPDWSAFMSRSGAAAAAAGLRHRPRAELIDDVLAWERSQGVGRERRAGLSPRRERELLGELGCDV
jgi:nucleoside-diphosphate-sugar epimerase